MRFAVLALVVALGSVEAQRANPEMLVSAEWLAKRIDDPRVVVLHVGHGDDYRAGHIPGARVIDYGDIVIERDGIGTELPPIDQLIETFQKVGISDDSHVVIYAHDGRMTPMASRVFFTLDHLGLQRVSLLNGGMAAWRGTGIPLSTKQPEVVTGRLTARPRPVTVGAPWVSARIGTKGIAFIDTRTTDEYLGIGSRRGLPSTGHIAGARQLEWEQLLSDVASGTFLDPASLAKLYSDRVAPGDTVVTYCLVGYRATLTYFGARLLGYPVRLYDGSYQEWARLGLPLKKGEQP